MFLRSKTNCHDIILLIYVHCNNNNNNNNIVLETAGDNIIIYIAHTIL